MSSKLKKGVEYIASIERTDFPNKGVAHVEEEKISIKGVLPGQKVKFVLGKQRSNHNEGKLREVIEKSPLEKRNPPCPHFGACGGCTYQMMEYKDQLELKSSQVKRLLDNVINYDYDFAGITSSPNEFEYRNKMEFSFGDCARGGELTLGLHRKGSFYDILQITDCKITDRDYNLILRFTTDICRKYKLTYTHKLTHEGYLRHLLIRRAATTGEILVNIVTTSQWTNSDITEEVFMAEYAAGIKNLDLNGSIVGVLHSVNNDPADAIKAERIDVLAGKEFYFEEILGLIFKITTFSFFQTNSFGAEKLYSIARDFIGDTRDKVIYDLYSGTGTIAQILAPVAKKVIGVEIIEEAVVAARENAALNNLDNCEFIAGDVLKELDNIAEKPDLIMLDPPREGIHPKALKKIIDYGVDRLVYISCKPTSLANDLVDLQEGGYRVVKVRCCDMFPQTPHIETVCLLERR